MQTFIRKSYHSIVEPKNHVFYHLGCKTQVFWVTAESVVVHVVVVWVGLSDSTMQKFLFFNEMLNLQTCSHAHDPQFPTQVPSSITTYWHSLAIEYLMESKVRHLPHNYRAPKHKQKSIKSSSNNSFMTTRLLK